MENAPLKKERDIVLPGEELVQSIEFLPGKNCFREDNSIYSKIVGLMCIDNRVISVIPLNSVYMPKAGDMIIARVEEIQSNGWVLDINAPVQAYLPLSGVREFIDTNRNPLSRYYGVDDILYASISQANDSSVYVSMQDVRARKFKGGRLIKINPAKVPRLIGKQGSMVIMIKNKTGCRINIGQNGLVWVDGSKSDLVEEIIALIERESHLEGLTDRIAHMLGATNETTKQQAS